MRREHIHGLEGRSSIYSIIEHFNMWRMLTGRACAEELIDGLLAYWALIQPLQSDALVAVAGDGASLVFHFATVRVCPLVVVLVHFLVWRR